MTTADRLDRIEKTIIRLICLQKIDDEMLAELFSELFDDDRLEKITAHVAELLEKK